MKKNGSNFFIVLSFLPVIILMVGTSVYVHTMRRSVWNECVAEVLEVTTQGGHAFEVYVKKGIELIDGRSEQFAQYDSTDTKSILRKLDLYGDTDTTFSVTDMTHGIVYYNSGTRTELSEETLSEYKKLSSEGIREPYTDEYTGQKTVGYYKRFKFADGADGLLLKGYLQADVSSEFSLSFYEDSGFSYIVNRDGDILLRPDNNKANQTYPNVFDVVEYEGTAAEDIIFTKDSIARGESGAIRFKVSDKEYIFAFVPIGSTDGWSLISIIPNSVILDRTSNLLNITQVAMLSGAMSLLFMFIFSFVYTQYNKKVKYSINEIAYREQLFGILTNNTDDVFLMLSYPELDVEYVTPNIERVLGVSQRNVQSDLSALGAATYKDGQDISRSDLLHISRETSLAFETERVHKKTGEHRWFRETLYRLMVEDSEKIIVIIADRTDEHQSELVLRDALDIANTANAAKSTFLSNMSHDIRTPMNAILGLAKLLERDAEKPDLVRSHTAQINTSGKHLLGLINDILDMSKIESGEASLHIIDFTIAEIMEELDMIIRPQTDAKNQTFAIVEDGIQSINLLGDKLRVTQILINILSNASKYTQEGGKINMRVCELPASSKNFAHIQFIVLDDGIGMSDEYIKNIFTPFSREVNSTTNKVLGTGLGMAITKHLVDLMGGTIVARSSRGSGSMFTVDLEFRISDDQRPREEAEKKSATEAAETANILSGKHVLAAEDDELNAEILTELLSMEDATCEIASNGKIAAQMFEDSEPGHFDLILMDVQMPVMNGYEATTLIRASKHPMAKTIPIIAMTANAFADDIKASMNAGMNAHLSKPVDIDLVEKELAKLL